MPKLKPFTKSAVEVADENEVEDDSLKNDEDFSLYFQFSTSLHPVYPECQGGASGTIAIKLVRDLPRKLMHAETTAMHRMDDMHGWMAWDVRTKMTKMAQNC